MPDSEMMQARAGISYRQLDHWTRQGYLASASLLGSGRDRTWSDADARVACLMKRLADAGLNVEVAHRAARTALTTGQKHRAAIRLGDGITIVIDGDPL